MSEWKGHTQEGHKYDKTHFLIDTVENFAFIRFVWPCLDDSDDLRHKMSQEFSTASLDIIHESVQVYPNRHRHDAELLKSPM